MTFPLAIIAPSIGARSETFIGRHIQDILPGGTVAVAESILPDNCRGWSVSCPVLTLEGLNRKPEGAVRWLLRKNGLKIASMSEIGIERFLKKHKVEVVMSEYLDFSLQWLPVVKKMGIRFYGHAHGYDISSCLREEKWRKEYLRYNKSSGVIAVSQASKSRLIDLGISESKIHTIPCSVDVPEMPQRKAPKKIIRCIAVGRMTPKKAPILTLDAFRRALEAFPSMHLDYVGAGNLFPAAQQFVRALGFEGKVTFHKGQPNEKVQQLMQEADIFLQHSMTDPETGDEEGLPVAVLEAMAKSLAVVSTRHAGIPEAVRNGITGYLVNEGDSVAMAERIKILATDNRLRERMGIAGWQRAKEKFTWENERTALLRTLEL